MTSGPRADVRPSGLGVASPPALLTTLVALEALLSAFAPSPRLLPAAASAAGALPMALGVWLHLEADRVFSEAGTTRATRGVPRRLVAHGVFRLSRNPMYLGGALFLLGLALALGAAVALVVPLLYVLLVGRLYVAPEETLLEGRFGAEYRSYRERVRRWL